MILIAKVTGLEGLAARLAARAALLAGARRTALALDPAARWRRADMLWPGFGPHSNQG